MGILRGGLMGFERFWVPVGVLGGGLTGFESFWAPTGVLDRKFLDFGMRVPGKKMMEGKDQEILISFC